MERPKKQIERLLETAGIKLDGSNPRDIHVHNKKLYARILCEGSLGLGESYMDGWWDCQKLDEFFYRLLRYDLEKSVKPWYLYWNAIIAKIYNFQKISRAFQIGQRHYDISNELFFKMLDETRSYSCGYWKSASNLEEAQQAKLNLIAKKLQLKPGMRVLDVGCGWGGAAKFMAEHYGVEVVGITVSKEQYDFAKEWCKGLPIDIRLEDYRSLNESFDRIYSIGMFEHVGNKNYKTYMRSMRRCLNENGLFLLHTIGHLETTSSTDPWISRYIFPNSMLPSLKNISKAIEGIWVLEDLHEFGAYYDKTLMAWNHNVETAWDSLKSNFDERFYRMWRYYLLSCAGSFRARKIQLWQFVLSPRGVLGGYERVS